MNQVEVSVLLSPTHAETSRGEENWPASSRWKARVRARSPLTTPSGILYWAASGVNRIQIQSTAWEGKIPPRPLPLGRPSNEEGKPTSPRDQPGPIADPSCSIVIIRVNALDRAHEEENRYEGVTASD